MSTMIDHRPERRASILTAGRAVLAEKGFEAAKISDIVALAGVAQGTFYLYFPSKLSLVMALAEDMSHDVLSAVQAAIEGASSLYEAVGLAIAAAFRVMEPYQDVLGLVHSRTGMVDIREECLKVDKPAIDYVASIIRVGQALGDISPAVNPEIASQLIMGLIEHAAHACFVLNIQRPTEVYMAEVVRFVRMALGIMDAGSQSHGATAAAS